METPWKILIATGPLNEEYLTAEIYFQGEGWGELSNFGNVMKVYPRNDGQPWTINPKELIEVLKLADLKLSGR